MARKYSVSSTDGVALSRQITTIRAAVGGDADGRRRRVRQPGLFLSYYRVTLRPVPVVATNSDLQMDRTAELKTFR